MSYFKVKIKPQGQSDFLEVTKDVLKLGNLREFNDEADFFSGVFRRGNLELTLDNNSQIYTTGESFFPNQRENSEVEIFYRANDENVPDILVFRGLITEGSTENDITSRNLNLVVVDSLKLIKNLSISGSDLKAIDSLYRSLRSNNIRVNKHYLACFLYYCFNTKGSGLNDVFNVFTNNEIGQYPNLNSSIEGLFSGDNSFYSATNLSALTILDELLRTLNSYSVLEYFEDKTELYVKARPQANVNPVKVTYFTNEDVLRVTNWVDGFNKIFNSVSINNSDPYTRASSISSYGVRVLNISSIMPATSFLAQTYLDYYSEPKAELNLVLRLRPETLDLRIGDVIRLDIEGQSNLSVQPIAETMYILNREINFTNDTVNLRLRQL